MLWFIGAVIWSAVKALRRTGGPARANLVYGALLVSAGVLFLVGGFLDTHVALLFRFFFALMASYSPGGIAGARVKAG